MTEHRKTTEQKDRRKGERRKTEPCCERCYHTSLDIPCVNCGRKTEACFYKPGRKRRSGSDRRAAAPASGTEPKGAPRFVEPRRFLDWAWNQGLLYKTPEVLTVMYERYCDELLKFAAAAPAGTPEKLGGNMEKPKTGLWRRNAETPEGKYLVKRRDGTVVEWPNFVLGAKDPAAPEALRAYADKALELGFNQQYVNDILDLAGEFEAYRKAHGDGDPDRGRHRKDDPNTIKEMRHGRSA